MKWFKKNTNPAGKKSRWVDIAWILLDRRVWVHAECAECPKDLEENGKIANKIAEKIYRGEKLRLNPRKYKVKLEGCTSKVSLPRYYILYKRQPRRLRGDENENDNEI